MTLFSGEARHPDRAPVRRQRVRVATDGERLRDLLRGIGVVDQHGVVVAARDEQPAAGDHRLRGEVPGGDQRVRGRVAAGIELHERVVLLAEDPHIAAGVAHRAHLARNACEAPAPERLAVELDDSAACPVGEPHRAVAQRQGGVQAGKLLRERPLAFAVVAQQVLRAVRRRTRQDPESRTVDLRGQRLCRR